MSVKALLKRCAYAASPRLAVAISASRGRRRSHRLVKEWGLWHLNQRLFAQLGNRVLGGPFAGMTLSALPLAEHVGPYLLGTCEAELHETWNRLLQREYRELVDVGANFGYYAVGLARHLKDNSLTLRDCEGYEGALFCDARCLHLPPVRL